MWKKGALEVVHICMTARMPVVARATGKVENPRPGQDLRQSDAAADRPAQVPLQQVQPSGRGRAGRRGTTDNMGSGRERLLTGGGGTCNKRPQNMQFKKCKKKWKKVQKMQNKCKKMQVVNKFL